TRAFEPWTRRSRASRFLAPLDFVEPGGERVELRLPIFAVVVDPYGRLVDRSGVEAAAADAAGALLGDEPGAHQHLDVARDSLERDGERFGEFRYQQVAPIEPAQDGAAHRVGERRENAVERRRIGLLGR